MSDEFVIDLSKTGGMCEDLPEKETLPVLSCGYHFSELPYRTRINEFSVSEKLGAGGMGHAYRVINVDTGARVVLKLFSPDYGKDMDYDPFEREVRMHSRVSHANIVKLHDCGEFEDHKYMVLEYVNGPSLAEAINQSNLPVIEQLRVIRTMASALEECHRRGVVHRDVKPENIILTTDGDAKLIDFSIAVDPSEPNLEKPGSIFGSCGYASPEQACGQTVDGRSDQWSLGIVWYCALSGEEPDGSSQLALLKWRPQLLPSVLHDSVPVTWDDVFTAMTHENRDLRYVDMAEVGAELDHLIETYRAPRRGLFARGRSLTNFFSKSSNE